MIAIEFTGEPPTDRMLRAGYEAEKNLAFYLDRAFREAAYDYRVFHGLRVERGEEAAQIDHLVLHRYGLVLVESKAIVESVHINEHGEFTRWFKRRPQGMPSPLAQAKRQAELLRELLNEQKHNLRRIVRVGPFKKQAEFSEKRFRVIAAISDRGHLGPRPDPVRRPTSAGGHEG